MLIYHFDGNRTRLPIADIGSILVGTTDHEDHGDPVPFGTDLRLFHLFSMKHALTFMHAARYPTGPA